MTRRSGYLAALGLLAVGGIGLVVAAGLSWGTQTVPLLAGGGFDRQVSVAGHQVAPVVAAAGWVALAAVAGIVATRGRGRRFVASIAVVAGLAGAGGAIAFAVQTGGADPVVAEGTGAWLVALGAGVAVAAAGAWAWVRATAWPVMGARYERPSADRSMSAWQQQDVGLDPSQGDGLVE